MITCMEVMNIGVTEGQRLAHIFPAVLHYSVISSYCQCQYQYGTGNIRNWESCQMKRKHKTHTGMHTHIQKGYRHNNESLGLAFVKAMAQSYPFGMA